MAAPLGNFHDKALAETDHGYSRAELIRGPAREARPCKSLEDVEIAALG